MLETVEIKIPLEEIEKEIERRELEKSFLSFCKYIFKHYYRVDFILNWHHELICHEMELVYSGKTRFLILNFPPRYSKTEICVKLFMAWSFAKKKYSNFIHLSYSDTLALENSLGTMEIIKSDCFQRLWPTEFHKKTKSKKLWHIIADGRKGGVYASSTGGQITGFGAGTSEKAFGGALIIDDPNKASDVDKKKIRDNINKTFNNTIKSRLNNPQKTPIVIVMQRLHEEDLAGFLLKGGSEFNFKHVKIPAIKEDDNHPMDRRKMGEALWVYKHNEFQLEEMANKDALNFAGQFQQRPSKKGGNIIHESDIKFYDHLPEGKRTIVHSWDCSFKDLDTSDFVVGLIICRIGGNYYVIDRIKKRIGFNSTIKEMERFERIYNKYYALLIEDKANGTAIIEVLKSKFSRVIAINPKESKVSRLESISPVFKSGSIFIPSDAYWRDDFIIEIINFPNHTNDDQVDALTQGINYLERNKPKGYKKDSGRSTIIKKQEW